MQRHLYVVFSSTPYKIGRMIRFFTHTSYNHVSVSLDPRLRTMYAFARRFYRTPFYGGFVIETPSRYRIGKNNAHIKVCRIPISQESYDTLQAHFAYMSAQKEQYLYNHFSVLGVFIRKRIRVKDAYMCIEFCIDALKMAGLPVDPIKYYSIKQAETFLAPYVIYTGPIFQESSFDQDYFSQKPLPHPIISSICSIAALFSRLKQS